LEGGGGGTKGGNNLLVERNTEKKGRGGQRAEKRLGKTGERLGVPPLGGGKVCIPKIQKTGGRNQVSQHKPKKLGGVPGKESMLLAKGNRKGRQRKGRGKGTRLKGWGSPSPTTTQEIVPGKRKNVVMGGRDKRVGVNNPFRRDDPRSKSLRGGPRKRAIH